MEDIFNAASSAPDAFESMTDSKPRSSFTPKKENYWDKLDIEPANVDVNKFKRSGKSFVIYVHPENDMPEDVYKKFVMIAKVAMENGYTFRHTGNKDNALHNEILKLEDKKVVSYLPWIKFNPNVSNPILVNPLGYKIAIGIHKAFMRMPAAVRAIIGRDVNALLGEDATDPVDLVLTWSEGGAEALSRDVDYKKIGNTAFILQVSKKAGLHVLNLYNKDFIERFKEVLSKSAKQDQPL